MPAKVADASVLAAIIFGEPRAAKAESLLAGVALYEPVLLGYELASVARKKSLRYPKQRDQIRAALDLAMTLDIEWVDVDHAAVLDLALEAHLTTYDAAYAYVAKSLSLPLVTFDSRLRRALRV